MNAVRVGPRKEFTWARLMARIAVYRGPADVCEATGNTLCSRTPMVEMCIRDAFSLYFHILQFLSPGYAFTH